MARPKKITITLKDGKDILFNNKYEDVLCEMNDSIYKRYMAAKQHALKVGQDNIKNRLQTLSINDFETVADYNKEYSNLKHYANIVADYIKENKKDFDLYFKASTSIDDLLKV